MAEALAGLRLPDVPVGALLIVPVGSTEQHGPHLPLGTDTVIAAAVAARLVDRLSGAVLAPPLPVGASGEHQDFIGTLSIGTDVLRTVIVELVRSATVWAGTVVLVNGHGGNVGALTAAVRQLHEEGRRVVLVHCATPGGDAHAGRTETSLMLHLRPASVGAERAAGDVRPLEELLPLLRQSGVAGISANGVLGDPSGATAAEGRRLLDAIVDSVVLDVQRRLGAVA